MKKNISAKPRSKNGTNQINKGSNPDIKWTIDNESLMQKMTKAIEGNQFLFSLLELGIYLMSKVDISSNVSSNVESMMSFRRMLGSRCKFYYDSDGNVYHHADSKEDFTESTVAHLLGTLSGFRVNLEYFELQDCYLKGINKYLAETFPEIYITYCKLSKEQGFDTNIICGSSKENMKSNYLNIEIIKKTNSELLELDDNLEIEKNHEISIGDISAESFEQDAEDFFLTCILKICSVLGHKIKDEPNESHQRDEILNSFNTLIGSKCKFSLSPEGAIRFNFEENPEFLDSNETALAMYLGTFACYKINLEFLEYQNPYLKGFNDLLKNIYPETYNAYCNLSKQFGFNNIVSLGLYPGICNKEIDSHFQNLKVVKWTGVEAEYVEINTKGLFTNIVPPQSQTKKDVKFHNNKSGKSMHPKKRKRPKQSLVKPKLL